MTRQYKGSWGASKKDILKLSETTTNGVTKLCASLPFSIKICLGWMGMGVAATGWGGVGWGGVGSGCIRRGRRRSGTRCSVFSLAGREGRWIRGGRGGERRAAPCLSGPNLCEEAQNYDITRWPRAHRNECLPEPCGEGYGMGRWGGGRGCCCWRLAACCSLLLLYFF